MLARPSAHDLCSLSESIVMGTITLKPRKLIIENRDEEGRPVTRHPTRDVIRYPTTTTCEAHLDHRLPSSHVKLKVHVCRLSGSGGGGKRGAPVCAAVCVLFCELLANEKELTRDTTL